MTSCPANFTWADVWKTISPGQTQSSNYAQWPVSTLNLSSTPTNDYLNWVIADTTSGGWIIPTSVFSNICFALTNETTGPSWHYFGGFPYNAIAPAGLPGTDSQPRVWWVALTNQTYFWGPY